MYSAEAIEVMAAVKAIFDPGNALNPGVLVDPVPLDADLRVPQARHLRRGLGFAYSHDGGDLSAAVHRCVGVGKCRADTTGSGGVMCPSWLATRDEKDSTRGRARVLQELANGSLVHGFGAAELAESLDLCLSCKGCSSDCPAGVDMATYKAEVLYQRYRRRPRPPAHYSLGWLPRWARLASRAPGLANAALRAPGLAGLAKRLGGIDTRRPLPRFAAQTFRAWFTALPRAAAGTPVLLWVDTFTDYFTPEVGRAAVRVLEAAGYAVQITAEPVCCGLTWISTGQLDGARRQLRRSLRALGPALDGDVPVVGLEPSCTAVLRGEITELLPDDPRASRAKAATRTLAELLTGTGDWEPPDLGGVRAVAQPHCHHHAVMGWHADSALLGRAGAEVTAVGGCCGLAGNFGVERGHYDVSAAVAETALLPAVRAAGDAVVLADGFSCRTQLDQLAGVSGTHLAQLLASRLEDRRLPDGLDLSGLGDEPFRGVVHAGLGGHRGPAPVHRHRHSAHRSAGDRPEHVAGRGDRGRGLALGQPEERNQRARAVRQRHQDTAVQHPGGRAQVRGPVQAGDHPVGAGLVEGQAELPGERHQRHEGVQINGHDRRLQASCIRRPAEPSGSMPGE
jgi:Fe-S oxidoreductase